MNALHTVHRYNMHVAHYFTRPHNTVEHLKILVYVLKGQANCGLIHVHLLYDYEHKNYNIRLFPQPPSLPVCNKKGSLH